MGNYVALLLQIHGGICLPKSIAV